MRIQSNIAIFFLPDNEKRILNQIKITFFYRRDAIDRYIAKIQPLTEFRNHIEEYIKMLQTDKKPFVLTQHGKAAAVLLDRSNYQEQVEFIRKVAAGWKNYKQDRVISAEKVFEEIGKILNPVKKN
ncbi:type II toxin-antitoxin system Phd/YefM family antitoxin [candidate division KSB1 bacterium]|nr:type II toxin-antitoxin system Phd/YefM family antitoxin [candidate division KSB1 bacterium]